MRAEYATWIEQATDPELRGWRILAATLLSASHGDPELLTEFVLLGCGRAAVVDRDLDGEREVVRGVVEDLFRLAAVEDA